MQLELTVLYRAYFYTLEMIEKEECEQKIFVAEHGRENFVTKNNINILSKQLSEICNLIIEKENKE